MEHITINSDRSVTVPVELRKIGVQYDHNVNTIEFVGPRYSSNVDLSTMTIYINYILSDKTPGKYKAENVIIDDQDNSLIRFNWTITRNVTKVSGILSCLVCAKKTDEEGNEINHWNTDIFRLLSVSEGMENDLVIQEQYPDVITSLIQNVEEHDTKLLEFSGLNNRVTDLENNIDELKDDLISNKYVVKDLPENTDLNELNDIGIFVWGANEGILNAPEGFNTGFILNAKTTIYKKYQIAIEPVSRKMYIRSGYPNWKDWVKAVYSDELLGFITDYLKRNKIAVKYTSGDGVDSSIEKFDIYVPKNDKYIHYIVVHTVNDDDRSNIWRVAYAYISSLDFVDEKQITTTGEWEMAIMLNGKDDFIGGFMHGDEIKYSVKFFANGVEWDETIFSELHYVDSFSFVQQSDMYDPEPPYLTYKVAEHYSLHEFSLTNEHQLEISQRVKWKMNLGFKTSYMAMFPIAKNMSTKYFNDIDYSLKTTPTYIKEDGVRELRLNSQSKNVSAIFGISEYPSYETGNKSLISDNGGTAYNKCYFIVGESGTTDTNNVWKSKTYYDILFN